MNKRKISICSLSVILFFMILSCEQPVTEGVIQDNAYTVAYHANGGTGEMKGKAETGILDSDVIRAFRAFSYDPGKFKSYSYPAVRSSIDNGRPVMAGGYTEEINFFGLKIGTGSGHYWVIDGYRRMSHTVKDKLTGQLTPDNPLDYVHCNMGWAGFCNGWYVSGVFDASKGGDGNPKNIPLEDPRSSRSAEAGFYKYGLNILTSIIPKK